MTQKEIEQALEKAIDAATDIVLAELGCHRADRDYAERRAYCRRLLTEFMCREAMP